MREYFSILPLFTILFLLLGLQQVNAISGSDWKAGRIIDDVIFTNKSSMSVTQIQNFLNSKVPNCDSNGTQISELGGGTRAEYGEAHNNPPPFTCLKDYYEVPKLQPGPTLPASNYGGKAIPIGAKSAAQIIWDAAQRNNISPKALLVIIQRESPGPLITDDWPFKSQYSYALGAHCPDSTGCDPNYAGFSIQVDEGASLLRWYLDSMDQPWWTYKKLGINSILWNVITTNCGAGNVNIETRATAALYTYTPYQPNKAALDNLYGTGDGCSAYGNRNFWRIFNDWFGFNSNLVSVPYAWNIGGSSAFIDPERSFKYTKQSISIEPGKKAYIRITARNMGNKTWSNENIRIGTYGPQDRTSIFQGSDWLGGTRPAKLIENSVIPGDYGTFEFELIAPDKTGTFVEKFNLLVEGITWMADQSLYLEINVTTKAEPRDVRATLKPGEYLSPGEYLLSPDGHNVLALNKNGSLVLYSGFNSVKTFHSKDGNKLIMQDDGNLVLYNKTGQALWHTVTHGNTGAHLGLKTNGNMIVSNEALQELWTSNTTEIPDLLYYVHPKTSTGKIFPGQSLVTADKKYRMDLQSDGNLVIYSPNRAIWANYTTIGKSVAYLAMQSDGNLVIYDNNGKALWHTHTNGKGVSNLVMQPDGNLVIYNQYGRPTWQTRTYDME